MFGNGTPGNGDDSVRFIFQNDSNSGLPLSAELRFTDPTGTAFNSVDLPTSIDLASFTSVTAYLEGPYGGGPGGIVTNLSVSVVDSPSEDPIPEPAVWALMIVGFGLVGAALRGSVRTAATTSPL